MKRKRLPKRRRPPGLKPSLLTVPEAADLIGYTAGGIYTAIRDKRLPGSRYRGQHVVKRADVIEFHRQLVEWIEKHERWKRGEFTEEEWLQRMDEIDPP